MRPTAGSYEDRGLEMNAGALMRAEDEDAFRRGWRDTGLGGEAREADSGYLAEYALRIASPLSGGCGLRMALAGWRSGPFLLGEEGGG